MNKRTDRIRSLFAQQPVVALSADNTGQEIARVASGSVRAVKDSLSGIERENEALRQQLATQSAILDIDPAFVDASPVADRMASSDDPSYDALKASLLAHGQEVPVLLRPHPLAAGRFQIAYGHRRVRAARELGLAVKATVRSLSDEELVVAQGLENSAREDLSFIERALFAARLEQLGYSRTVVQQALAIDRAEASKLVAVAKAIPDDVCAAIGRASRIGRGRWQELAEVMRDSAAQVRIRAVLGTPGFAKKSSDERFVLVLAAAKVSDVRPDPVPLSAITSRDGHTIARFKTTQNETSLIFDRTVAAGFGAFLARELPQLFDTYTAQAKPERS